MKNCVALMYVFWVALRLYEIYLYAYTHTCICIYVYIVSMLRVLLPCFPNIFED